MLQNDKPSAMLTYEADEAVFSILGFDYSYLSPHMSYEDTIVIQQINFINARVWIRYAVGGRP